MILKFYCCHNIDDDYAPSDYSYVSSVSEGRKRQQQQNIKRDDAKGLRSRADVGSRKPLTVANKLPSASDRSIEVSNIAYPQDYGIPDNPFKGQAGSEKEHQTVRGVGGAAENLEAPLGAEDAQRHSPAKEEMPEWLRIAQHNNMPPGSRRAQMPHVKPAQSLEAQRGTPERDILGRPLRNAAKQSVEASQLSDEYELAGYPQELLLEQQEFEKREKERGERRHHGAQYAIKDEKQEEYERSIGVQTSRKSYPPARETYQRRRSRMPRQDGGQGDLPWSNGLAADAKEPEIPKDMERRKAMVSLKDIEGSQDVGSLTETGSPQDMGHPEENKSPEDMGSPEENKSPEGRGAAYAAAKTVDSGDARYGSRWDANEQGMQEDNLSADMYAAPARMQSGAYRQPPNAWQFDDAEYGGQAQMDGSQQTNNPYVAAYTTDASGAWQIVEEDAEAAEERTIRIPWLGIAVSALAILAVALWLMQLNFASQTEKILEARRADAQALLENHPYHYGELIEREAAKNNLHPAFVAALVLNESSFNPQAESSVGARGLMQMMDGTAQDVYRKKNATLEGYQFDDLYKAETNVEFGCWYLGYLSETFRGDPILVAAGYHAGPTQVKNWLNDSTYSSDHVTLELERMKDGPTKRYAGRVLKDYAVYKRLYFEYTEDET